MKKFNFSTAKRHKTAPTAQSDSHYKLLLQHIQDAKTDLDCAYLNFEHATDPDLIDCYIYQLKSAQMRYKYLLESIRQADAHREQHHQSSS